ncbi:putative immune-type receptor 13 isoform 1 precursor, partial [Silurus meridionalis]
VSADTGYAVSLRCPLEEQFSNELIVWYQQKLGGIPQAMGMSRPLTADIIFAPFNKSAFQLERTKNLISLNILHVNKDDEAIYFCGRSRVNIIEFSSGIFLSVRDKLHQGVSVFQSSVSDSVPAGASVTLQCSVLSESRAAELQVLWFRAAPSQSHPQLIYTHHNSSLQCESESSTHTCVYNLSKNIFSLNDTGTYYCAVVLCGKIIFGNGTRVQLEDCASSNPVVMSLGTVLVMCGILISVQAALLCKRKNSQQHRVSNLLLKKCSCLFQQGRAAELNYSALHFNKKKNNSERRKSERPHDIVYSEVK